MIRFNPTPALRTTGSALLLALGLAASAQAASPASADDKGRRFYEKVCARCHEADIGPVLLGRRLPPVFFKTIARSGFNAMPAFRITDVDEATLQAVAEYLSTSKPKN
ncbi:c-type cytochrome [Thauera linaloolentis]|uniref:Putative p-cresol methylhydroxylase subunit n=1 Tax=Thauera linaloolentis (strain DSM 12138 / JCM 21573 / CCUG 41526 / CIP 105981 / IAM 15112 / NBRC 102519 / 47Lol) TaxID=1123367 RepID=N6YYF0_THAL4|nr:cytochrome c [Thauera linaloolentis]ENO84944.1 putative p-cresol methylhydroxylase subunit [Thauera linaloolentis 47Lol = DSM 12138]MCM8566781.1 cytochrome c [Thauera linaloolentis]